jgi:hypothetical protein
MKIKEGALLNPPLHRKNYFFTVVLLTFVTFDDVTFDEVRLEGVLFVAVRFATGAVVFTTTFVVTTGGAVVVATCVVGTGVATFVATVVVGVVAGWFEVHPAVIMTTAITRTSKIEDVLIQLMKCSPF